MKYKVGDRVKIIKIVYGAPDNTKGKIGTIEETDYVHKDYTVSFNTKIEGSNNWFYREEELTLAKYVDTPLWKVMNE